MFSSFGTSVQTGGLDPEDLVYFEAVEKSLRSLEHVSGTTVLVYGSVARNGCGNDLDIIILGTEEMWLEFKSRVLQNNPIWCGALNRQKVAREMFKELGTLEDESFVLVDVYVFPSDWTKRLDELQAAFPHEDPNFMQNIAGDAKTLGECAIEAAHRS